MVETNLSRLRRRLLHWYKNNRRDLPWRQSRDPYAIWISETMLQQTQVKTMLPYFARFLAAFPTAQALASAPLDRVLRHWSGLGYYRRAENLHKAARQIVADHGGNLPRRYEQLRALPGVGDYTAGALASIAFKQKYPAVDGNVRRVLGRLFGVISEASVRGLAAKLANTAQPGNLNQALMELGAMICAPKQPRCGVCPAASHCQSKNQPSRRSMPPRQLTRAVTWPLAIVNHRGKILLRRRARNGLLAKLWELPGAEIAAEGKPEAALHQELRALASLAPQPLGQFTHSITNRRIVAPVLLYRWSARRAGNLNKTNWRWVAPAQLHRYATSSMTGKAVKLFLAHEKSPA